MNRFKLLSGGVAASMMVLAASAVAQGPGEWTMTGRTPDLQRYSPLTQINKANVKSLKAAWTFSTGVLNGHEGNPLVINNVMYVHSAFPNAVAALDLTKPGAPMIWRTVPAQPPEAKPIACCDLVNRGLAYHPSGKLFIELLAGDLLALDAKSGKQIWRVPNADYKTGSTMTNAPIVIKDIVIAGISGGEFGVRGRVTAYDVNTGKELWRAYSTGPDADVKIVGEPNSNYASMKGKDLGVSTWQGDEWQHGGGTTWGWYSYDPTLNLFYYSTGNPGTWNPDQRLGDNKWSMTIWARDPDTGMAKWGYQMTPHDAWDYDGVNENILADLTIGGKKVQALVHFDRNGFGYTLDRTNGTLLVAEPFVAVNWAKSIDKKTGRPVEDMSKRTKQGVVTKDICPNAMGGKDQQPAAFSPKTGLFYVPTNNMCMDYEATEVKYTAGAPYVGANVAMKPGPGGELGELIAWDATTGKKVWGIKEHQPCWGGVLATASDVVFYGTMDGWFKAVHAKTGKLLWKHKVGSGIIGAPMTFLGPNKKQYVAVYSGVGGWFGLPVSQDLPSNDPYAALGAVGLAYKNGLDKDTTKGGMVYVFELE